MPPSTEAGPSRARHEADLLPKSKRSKKAHPEYDPNQDSDVKRELRKQYRSLIADTEGKCSHRQPGRDLICY